MTGADVDRRYYALACFLNYIYGYFNRAVDDLVVVHYAVVVVQVLSSSSSSRNE